MTTPARLKNNQSLGLELNIKNFDRVEQEFLNNTSNHIQVSIPGLFPITKIKQLPENSKIILHSNIFNTFGSNNFELLQTLASQLNSLKIQHLVEHFTLFRDEKGKKYGVQLFDFSDEKKKSEIIRNISRWTQMINVPIYFENVPITENILEYFIFLKQVKEETNVGITIDVPHLMISEACLAGEEEKASLLELVKELSTNHIHVAGVRLNSEKIEDNHSLLNFNQVLNYAKKHFEEVEFITIEQADSFEYSSTVKYLERVQTYINGSLNFQEDISLNKYTGNSLEYINEGLSRERTRDYKGVSPIRDSKYCWDAAGSIATFNLYNPFTYILDEIIEPSKLQTEDDVVENLFAFIKWSLNFSTWLGRDELCKVQIKSKGEILLCEYFKEDLQEISPDLSKYETTSEFIIDKNDIEIKIKCLNLLTVGGIYHDKAKS